MLPLGDPSQAQYSDLDSATITEIHLVTGAQIRIDPGSYKEYEHCGLDYFAAGDSTRGLIVTGLLSSVVAIWYRNPETEAGQ